ncbi:MAG: BatD family protein [Marinilabiliales bacterium]
MKYFSLILILFLSYNLFAEDIKFTASAKNVVSTGENFRLVYEVNAGASNLRLPELNGFSVVAGPMTSSSSSIQIINGVVQQNVSYTYTYFLVAEKEGTFEIPPAQIDVNGKTYNSNSLTITVVKGSAPANTSNNNATTSNTNVQNISNDNLFVRLHLSRSNIYQGEYILATIKIYTKENLVGFQDMQFPQFNGFWAQEIEQPGQIQLVKENVNGQIYNVGVLAQYVLFPQQSGQLTIDAFNIECVVRKRVSGGRRSFFDFFDSYQDIVKKISSLPVKVNVNALPPNKPVSFNGAVGTFTLKTQVDNNEVDVNSPVSIKITLNGNGNLKLFDIPELKFPKDFEVYDPQLSENITTNAAGSTGQKSIEYLVIPRHAGIYKIPPVAFSYFDLKTNTYKTLYTDEINIKVNKGDGSVLSDENATVISGFSQDVEMIGKDIRYLKDINSLEKRPVFYSSTIYFYLSYLVALILFTIILIWQRKRIKQRADIVMMKNKKANKVAKSRLKIAEKALNNKNLDEFYEAVTNAFWGYISDKYNIPVAKLSRDTAKQVLVEKNIDESMIEELINIIDECEYARFAPAQANKNPDEIYNDALNLIAKLENVKKS